MSRSLSIIALVLLVATTACSGESETSASSTTVSAQLDEHRVVIGVPSEPELAIVAVLYGQAVAARGSTVELAAGTDAFAALVADQIDLTPQYAARTLTAPSTGGNVMTQLRAELATRGLIAFEPTESTFQTAEGPDVIAPMLTQQFAKTYDDLFESTIDSVTQRITSESLGDLVAKVDAGSDIQQVAREFLLQQHLIGA